MQVIVGCLVEDDGKILVVSEASEKNYGKWNYPVGHLEVGESICEGAIRETYEETGYNVELSGVLPIQEVNKNGEKYVLIIFLAFDLALTASAVIRAKKWEQGIPPSNFYEKFLDKTFNKDYLYNMFNNSWSE